MRVMIAGEPVPIDRSVFVDLLENSVVNGRVPYINALEKSKIQYSDLLDLARKAEVPHPLFFAPPAVAQAQLRTKTAKLLQGVAPDTFTVNTRISLPRSSCAGCPITAGSSELSWQLQGSPP